MPKTLKIGNTFVSCFTREESARIPNNHLGKNCRIHVPQTLLDNKKISKYVNNDTMGALDNYAEHENLSIYMSPLENDLFDDLKVSVFKVKSDNSKQFTMKIQETKDGFFNFMKELYTKVGDAVKEFNTSK